MQKNAFLITINNPLDYGFTREEIKKKLLTDFKTFRYACMSDEIGEKGTPHTHIFVYFDSRVRIEKVKKSFPQAHIDITNGTIANNIDYIKKSGKWEDSKKAETSIDGSFEEIGSVPKQNGKRGDLEELYNLVNNGYRNNEIVAMNNDFIPMIDQIDKLRNMILTDRYKRHRRTDMKVIYIYGASGTGKTRGVLDKYGDERVYRVTDYSHMFDGYECQEVLVFDEFRSQVKISDMLNYLDIYPVQLPARYNNKCACYNTVYLLSNWSLEEQYKNVQDESWETWKAFLRRIDEVHIYDKDGDIDVYKSIKGYFDRGKQLRFKDVTNKIKYKPFKS